MGVEDVAFMAVRRASGEDYVPVLTVRGYPRVDTATLDEIADDAIGSLRESGMRADVVKRTTIDSARVPAIVQLVEVEAVVDGNRLDLYQAQVIEAVVDSDESWKRIVLTFTVTCKYGQWSTVGPEFQDFISEVELVPEAAEILARGRE